MIRVLAITIASVLYTTTLFADAPYMATGIKIGEVTDTTAIIWVRLTENAERVDFGSPIPKISYTNARTGKCLNSQWF